MKPHITEHERSAAMSRLTTIGGLRQEQITEDDIAADVELERKAEAFRQTTRTSNLQRRTSHIEIKEAA